MSADRSEDTSEERARPGAEGRGAADGMSADRSEDTSEERARLARDESGEPAIATGPIAVIVLTEEALKPVDVDKILGLHAGESTTYRVLVPADTQRNMLSSFLNHLSLFEMREALEALRPIDRDDAHLDAEAALAASLAEFEQRDVTVTGEITADDPMPALEEEVTRLRAREVVVVTEPQAVEETFHTDWASKARDQLGLPVLHMYAGDWRLG